eukprot:m.148452 g.148452  ORF g.148452 m.148452 type:complete len:67 (+) comp14998_c0_seq4:143-343(+)
MSWSEGFLICLVGRSKCGQVHVPPQLHTSQRPRIYGTLLPPSNTFLIICEQSVFEQKTKNSHTTNG